MNLLLDTHVVLWAFTNDPTISEPARQAIVDGANTVFVSAATAWEIAIKRSLGKLQAPANYEEELRHHRFTPLSITTAHALAVEHLPALHHDPFDRILVAQAVLERLTLVTRDPRIRGYGVRTIEA
jgi:PIN domain nuclease of toxin-antitoxin system